MIWMPKAVIGLGLLMTIVTFAAQCTMTDAERAVRLTKEYPSGTVTQIERLASVASHNGYGGPQIDIVIKLDDGRVIGATCSNSRGPHTYYAKCLPLSVGSRVRVQWWSHYWEIQ